MGEDQRVGVKMAIEDLDLAPGDGAGLVAHHGAMAGVEVADREMGELARDQALEARDALPGEALGGRGRLSDRAQRVEDRPEVRALEGCAWNGLQHVAYLPVGKSLVN